VAHLHDALMQREIFLEYRFDLVAIDLRAVAFDTFRCLPGSNVFLKLGFVVILMLGEHLDNYRAVAGINLKVWCGLILYGDRLYLEARFQESAIGTQFREGGGCFFGIIHTAKARSKGTKPCIVPLNGDTCDRSVGEVVDRARFRVEDRIPRREPSRRNQRCGLNGFKLFVRKQITYSLDFHG